MLRVREKLEVKSVLVPLTIAVIILCVMRNASGLHKNSRNARRAVLARRVRSAVVLARITSQHASGWYDRVDGLDWTRRPERVLMLLFLPILSYANQARRNTTFRAERHDAIVNGAVKPHFARS